MRPPPDEEESVRILTQLQEALSTASLHLRQLESCLARKREGRLEEAERDRLQRLEREMAATRDESRELATRLVEAEQQAGRLMNLYVAIYQLHSTLDPAEVQATIAEIAMDLLGAQRFALLLRTDDGPGYEIALGHGLAEEAESPYSGDRYRGGDPMVDHTLADGVMRLQPVEGSTSVAAVPLRVQAQVVGALVLRKLFDHRQELGLADRELLDLLAAHAASALVAARSFTTSHRKLHSLESLIRLVRPGPGPWPID